MKSRSKDEDATNYCFMFEWLVICRSGVAEAAEARLPGSFERLCACPARRTVREG